MANMAKTIHMNTPEQTIAGVDIDDLDDNSKNKLSSKQGLIEQLQTQLIQNQIRRKQPRNYKRILCQSNKPVYWYKAPPLSRSVYFYDPNYQKYVQQRSTLPQKTKPNIHSISSQLVPNKEHVFNHANVVQHNSVSFLPRTKYMLDLYNTTVNYHQQKQRFNQNYQSTSLNVSQQHLSIPSRLQSMPTLPPINISKQQNDELSNPFIQNEQQYELLNINEKELPNHQPIIIETRKKFKQIVMPPSS